ncbi:MAG TPA: M48 family metallopeptidase, partial [Burkholderiaceae bacterium]|nr:M48 family metallopeptidase [Burkholderiaceae bacterium]
AERQQALRAAFAHALAQAGPELARTPYDLRFHASPARGAGGRGGIGPNAFALPGGTIVVTDEMLALLQGRDDVLIGVLGHELGHVRRRHGMRLLVQTTLIATASSLAWGDFSSVLAAAPALLGQRSYSRDFEREADTDAITLLQANGLSPALMVELFERLAAQRSGAQRDTEHRPAVDLGIALASHPDDAERIARFREAAAR